MPREKEIHALQRKCHALQERFSIAKKMSCIIGKKSHSLQEKEVMHRWKEMSCITGKETRALQENKVMRCGKDTHALQEKDSCIIKRGTIHT